MKTVVIGLDGATFDIIKPLSEAGALPVLSRLMSEGCSAPLRSTILPNSFPGWSSCTTGTSEGMHGVFSPFIKLADSYSVRPMSGRDILTRPIWDVLGESGGRSIVVNVPTTYPPEPLAGSMITGMLTPSIEADFTYPASLKHELLSHLPDYIIEPGRNPDRHARAAEFARATEMHEQAVSFLLKRGEWDFLMVVFSVLDRAQHDFWADMDPNHPRHDPRTPVKFRELIDRTYMQLDAAIGRLLELLPDRLRLFIVSDHGFCSELFEVRVNEVLARAGLLKFRTEFLRREVAAVRELKGKLSRRLGFVRLEGNSLEKKVRYGGAFLDEIDFKRSRAYFAQDKGVWVNLEGRERAGCVPDGDYNTVLEEARAALLSLCFDGGESVFESVMTRSEAFNGRGADRLPDLVMIPRRDQWVYNERPGYGASVVPADSTTGTHARDGIFIGWGAGIKSTREFTARPRLRDLAPTALASLGCQLPEDLDGGPLKEIFSEWVEPVRKGTAYRRPSSGEPGKDVYGAEEAAEVTARLRALGYIK